MSKILKNKEFGLIKISPTRDELIEYYNSVANGNLYVAVKTSSDGDKKIFLEDCDPSIAFGIYRVFSKRSMCDIYISNLCKRMGYDKGSFAIWESKSEILMSSIMKVNEDTLTHFNNTITAIGCTYRDSRSMIILDIYWSGNSENMV